MSFVVSDLFAIAGSQTNTRKTLAEMAFELIIVTKKA